MKAIEDIIITRSGDIVEMSWLNLEKGYGHIMWLAVKPRDYNSVETIKSRDSEVHQSIKLHSKISSSNSISQGYFSR